MSDINENYRSKLWTAKPKKTTLKAKMNNKKKVAFDLLMHLMAKKVSGVKPFIWQILVAL